MSKVPRFKENKSFEIKDLNRLVDGVNEVKDTYDEAQRIIHEMKKVLATYQNSTSHFLDRYAAIIQNTPEIIELIKYNKTKPVYAPQPVEFFVKQLQPDHPDYEKDGDNNILYVKYSKDDPGTVLGPVIHFRGIPGKRGPIGPQGIPGRTGPKGEEGPTTLYRLHHVITNAVELPSVTFDSARNGWYDETAEDEYIIDYSVVQVQGAGTTLEKGNGLYLWYKDNTTGAIGWEFIGDYGAIKGEDGANGRAVVLSIDYENSTLQWQYAGDTEWIPLITLPSLEEWQSQIQVHTDSTLVGDGSEMFPLGVANTNDIVEAAITEHNTSSTAHADIRRVQQETLTFHDSDPTAHQNIQDKAEANLILHKDDPIAHSTLFFNADNQAASKVNAHNVLPTSHPDIRADVEQMFANALYNTDTKEVVFVRHNGEEVRIPSEDLVANFKGFDGNEITTEVTADGIINAVLKHGVVTKEHLNTELVDTLDANDSSINVLLSDVSSLQDTISNMDAAIAESFDETNSYLDGLNEVVSSIPTITIGNEPRDFNFLSDPQAQLDLKETTANKGKAGGYASLDDNGKIPSSQINDSVLGNVSYQGQWNASTNVPNLDSVRAKGNYYIVSVGATRYGIVFADGDWIISNGDTWDKVSNTDAVSSVAGRTGNVILTKADIAEIDQVDNTSDIDKPISSATQTALNDKVDKVAGKQLSTEDYTSAEKTKLSSVATGANNYTLPTASPTVTGGLKTFSATVQSVAANAVTATASRTYGVQLNASGQAVVNVPWSDSNTTYTAVTQSANGLMIAADKAKLDGIAAGAQANTVTSVAGKTGAITLDKADVGLGNVNNTSDAAKPISTAVQTALNAKLNATDSSVSTYKLAGLDLRNENWTPQQYFAHAIGFKSEFKSGAAIGITEVTYCLLLTNIPWSDSSGGFPSQVAYLPNGKIYVRYGISNTAWSAWANIYTSQNPPVTVSQSGATLTITIQ